MPWHPVPRRAACTYLRAGALTCSRRIGAVTCGWLIKLRSAYILGYFIRNRRLAVVVCIAFFNEEYHIVCVDFIVALRRTKGRGRRTLRSPPSPSSGLHLIHPGDPLRRGISAAAVDRDIVSRIPVQVDNRQFRILCSYLCSGWDRSRFSRVVWLWSFVFHYWCEGLFVPAATVGFAMVFRRICADRDWVVSFGWKRYVITCIVIGLDWMGYPFS